ncbi:hypothetical protein [Aliiroseovarius crassostreae]|uniref:hypothetical protein n=1 Tax=Aliiroseovarius crassostreae TaxID=154981 RepID=UPI0022099FFC|nr:hypothetical protein [Aliiroseovarius crassostreae]UWQ04198.1 hypothetical protein K3X22_10965 [Aliiroseovarius crassostreae]
MIALWTSFALLAAGVIWATLVYRHISHVSQGDKIPERSGTALLLKRFEINLRHKLILKRPQHQ